MRNKMRNIKTVKSWVVASLLSFTFLLSRATAQEAIVTAGIDVSGNSGSLSYSVGQVVYQIYTGTGGSVTEGVQQPYRIPAAPEIKKAGGIIMSFAVFPNPATDFLDMRVENFNNENLSLQLIDIHGKVLYNQKITASQTRVVTGNLASAVYGLQVMLDKKLVKTFKIIKN
jgi:hypothetical protein